MAENDPSIVKFRRIPVGNTVVYHGRSGSMRQGRTTFPATVLKQHEDDGSLDLIVDFEAEDRIWEQRVLPWSETQSGHCWEPVEPIEGTSEHQALAQLAETMRREFQGLSNLVSQLKNQMYGDYDIPNRAMIEYLDDFDKRLKKLERKA
jgi:hypothetical protein